MRQRASGLLVPRVDRFASKPIVLQCKYAETFIDGPEDESSSVLVAMSMVRIATSVMIAHETRIAQLLGKDAILDLARGWVKKNSPSDQVGIGLRLPILDQVL